MHFLKMFFSLFAFQFFHVLLYKIDNTMNKVLLKRIDMTKKTDCNPVFRYLYGSIYLQQWPRFITPKPNLLPRY